MYSDDQIQLKIWNLNNLVLVWRRFGQRLHTNTRLFKFQILTLKDELELAEKKFLWKSSQNKLPLGVKNILEPRTNVLRGYRFKIKKEWKTTLISFRWNKHANTDFKLISTFLTKKTMVKLIRKKILEKYKQECRIQNCFICNNPM
jgi:hypothetical protein